MSSTTTTQSVITLNAVIRVVAPTVKDRANGVSFKLLDIVEVDGQSAQSLKADGVISDTGKAWSKVNITVTSSEDAGTIADAMALEPTVFVKREATDAETVEAEAADKSII